MLHTVPHFCRKKSRRTDRERGRSPFLRWRPIEARAARPHPASAKSYKPPPDYTSAIFFLFAKSIASFCSPPTPHRTVPRIRRGQSDDATPRSATDLHREETRQSGQSPVSSSPPSASTCPRFFFLPPTLDWD
jgi:hypothetical protein